MSLFKKGTKDILNRAAQQEGLDDEFDKHSFTKWRSLVDSWLIDSKTYNKFKTFLFYTQLVIGAASVLIALLVRNVTSPFTAIMIWVIYALILLFVNMVYKFYPDDYEKMNKDVRILKLKTLSEKLAAKLSLFERLTDHDVDDRREVIDQISYRIKDISEMNEEIKSVIEKCLNPQSRFTSSRGTNITLCVDDYDLSDNEKVILNNITKEMSEAAEFLFGGKGYSAKLYMRIIKEIKGEEVEILVPFSRFPNKESYGSSWIKSRGNLSAVWETLERGESKVVDFSDQSLYYKSILAICLPGRIGVLAIHNEDSDVFEANELDSKALALVTKQMVMEALEIIE